MTITEIMYDLSENQEGSTSDAKREWVEIYNEGNNEVDVSEWRFNDGKNHLLIAPPENGGQGSITLAPNSYAILASDATTFVNEHGSYSGTVIDTVMSLNNTTDTLSLIDGTGVTVDSVTYTNELGGDEDGNSLQLVGSAWVASAPTPGAQNTGSGGSESEEEESQKEESSSSAPPSNGSVYVDLEERITAKAPGDKTVIVGAAVEYRALAFGMQNKPLANARYVWNFGNGETKEGQSVLHTYHHPGEYVLFLNVSSGKLSSTDRALITVVEGDIVISAVKKDSIELHNRVNVELNLSWWQLRAGEDTFMLPRDTIVLPKKKLIFAKSVTGLSTDGINNVALLYPNGIVAHTYGDDTPFIKQEFSRSISTTDSGNQSEQAIVIEATRTPSGGAVGVPLTHTEETLPSEEDSMIDTSDLEAAVVESVSENTASDRKLITWLIGLFVLMGIAIAGVVLGRTRNVADDIEILD